MLFVFGVVCGISTPQKINYIYSADGVKLQKIAIENGSITTTSYAGNYVYEGSSLKFFNHAEGYVEPVNPNNYSAGFNYIYQYKDHLGNVRLSYSDTDGNGVINASTEIIEENNYYPFGLQHQGYNNVINGTENNYHTYNGKELNESLGLNWLDFEERNYDPALGRWMNIDPLSELMTRHSPYNFAFDNPIYYIDPDGMMPFGAGGLDDSDENYDFGSNGGPQHHTRTYVDKTGKIIKHIDDDDPNIYLVLDPENGLNEDWVIGTERSGVTYREGEYLHRNDLDEPYRSSSQALTSEFLLKISDGEVEPQLMIFWGAEFLEGGGLVRAWKYLNAWNKYRKLSKNSKFMKQLIRQLEKDGSKSISKSYQKLLRRLKEHQTKLDDGLEYSSSVEREIRTFSKQIEELEIFMTKHKMKF